MKFDYKLAWLTRQSDRVKFLHLLSIYVLRESNKLHPKDISVDVRDSVVNTGAQVDCPIPVLTLRIWCFLGESL